MKNRAVFVLGIILAVTSISFAQQKTVTNKDLEKFKQKRLEAEKDLRENYQKLGFPSPEVMEMQNKQSRKELSELSQRLRQARLDREQFESRQTYQTQIVDNGGSGFIDYQQYYGATYFTNFNRNNRFRHNQGNRRFSRGSGNRFQRFFGNGRGNRRITAFGPDRRLTRQNQVKSQRANRAFRTSLFYGTRQN